jgi:hypothetical protein
MLSLKITKAEVKVNFEDDRRCYLGKSRACYKMVNYRPISMKVDTQTKTGTLSLKITAAKVYGHLLR